MNRILGLLLSIWIAFLGLSVLLFGLSGSTVMAEQPETPEAAIVVNSLDDDGLVDGDCSLREAITAANEDTAVDACPAGDAVITDTITFDVAGTITVTNQLTVTAGGPLAIDGGEAITISGGDSVQIVLILTDADLALHELTLEDGSGGWGSGGISNQGTLEIINCTLSRNMGFIGGGIGNGGTLAIFNSILSGNNAAEGGGIYNSGVMTIIESTLLSNSARGSAGAISNSGALTIINSTVVSNTSDESSGGISNSGVMTVTNSTLTGNDAANNGGGINNYYGTLTLTNSTLLGNSSADYGGGIYNYVGTLTIINSTLSGNSARVGGGILNSGTLTITDSVLSSNNSIDNGGGIENWGSLTITNSTLSGNSSASSGGIENSMGMLVIVNTTLSGNSAVGAGGGINNGEGTLTMTHSTISGNSAGQGGSIYNFHPFGQAEANLSNNIITNSPSGGNCAGQPITDIGYNLEDTDSCGFDPTKGSLPNTDPLLGPLQDNGGATFTHALLENSPAIDAGDNAQCPEVDQRGVLRPQDGDREGYAGCDIGAYEVEGPVTLPSQVVILGPVDGVVGQSYVFTATVGPITTTWPLNYIWQASSQGTITHTGWITDMVSFTWQLPGTQVITVTASNNFGTVTDTHTITINVPISGLVASNDSPTLLGTPTTFTATVEAGTNVSYAWDFGDASSGTGAVVTHVYATAGVHTATVTATNSLSSAQTSTMVDVVIPETRIFMPLIRTHPIPAHSASQR